MIFNSVVSIFFVILISQASFAEATNYCNHIKSESKKNSVSMDIVEYVYFYCDQQAFKAALLRSTNVAKTEKGFIAKVDPEFFISEGKQYQKDIRIVNPKIKQFNFKDESVVYTALDEFSKNYLSINENTNDPKQVNIFVQSVYGKSLSELAQISEDRERSIEEANRGLASEADEDKNEKEYKEWIKVKPIKLTKTNNN